MVTTSDRDYLGWKMEKEGGDNSKGKHMIQNILHQEKTKEPSNVQSSLYVCFNNEHFLLGNCVTSSKYLKYLKELLTRI